MPASADAGVILASASPRRAELLRQIGVAFRVATDCQVDETVQPGEDPIRAAERLAREKAAACRERYPESRAVVAADTMVVLDGKILGKPADPAEAAAMLGALSGRTHDVVTGWAVAGPDRVLAGAEITRVRFRVLTAPEIATYVATGEPLDKAGAYGIQGRAAVFVPEISGDYFTVVGLPLSRVGEALKSLGIPFGT